jgi:hypothetical protein
VQVVSRGSDQTTLSTRYESREEASVKRGYGQFLLEMCCECPVEAEDERTGASWLALPSSTLMVGGRVGGTPAVVPDGVVCFFVRCVGAWPPGA